jgi:hypothetical protein
MNSDWAKDLQRPIHRRHENKKAFPGDSPSGEVERERVGE